MEKLSDYLLSRHPKIPLSEISRLIMDYNYFSDKFRGKICDICYKYLTEADLKRTTSHDFNYTCEAHKRFSDVLNRELIREQNNIKTVYPQEFDIKIHHPVKK